MINEEFCMYKHNSFIVDGNYNRHVFWVLCFSCLPLANTLLLQRVLHEEFLSVSGRKYQEWHKWEPSEPRRVLSTFWNKTFSTKFEVVVSFFDQRSEGKGLVTFKTGYPVGVSFGFRPDFFVPHTGLMNIFVPLNFFRLYFAPLKLSFIPLKSSLQIFRPLKSGRINFRLFKSCQKNVRPLKSCLINLRPLT